LEFTDFDSHSRILYCAKLKSYKISILNTAPIFVALIVSSILALAIYKPKYMLYDTYLIAWVFMAIITYIVLIIPMPVSVLIYLGIEKCFKLKTRLSKMLVSAFVVAPIMIIFVASIFIPIGERIMALVDLLVGKLPF
jgi:hypothetical protein